MPSIIDDESEQKQINKMLSRKNCRLFIAKIAADFVGSPMKSQSFSARYPDGSAEITIEATDEMEILPVVQWYLPLVKIVEPQWLADEFKTTIQEYLEEISN